MTTYTPPEPAAHLADSLPLYSESQLLQAYAAGQRDMRDAAAKLVDDETEDVPLQLMADAIRELPIGEI